MQAGALRYTKWLQKKTVDFLDMKKGDLVLDIGDIGLNQKAKLRKIAEYLL